MKAPTIFSSTATPLRMVPWPLDACRRVGGSTGTDAKVRALRAAVAYGLFRNGCDTLDIARVLRVDEPEASRLVEAGRAS
jgi:hypothetical protein